MGVGNSAVPPSVAQVPTVRPSSAQIDQSFAGISAQAWNWIAFIMIFVAALLTNPTADVHREKVRRAITQAHPVASFFGAARLAPLTLNYKTLWVASYTQDPGSGAVVSIGAFGLIFVRNV